MLTPAFLVLPNPLLDANLLPPLHADPPMHTQSPSQMQTPSPLEADPSPHGGRPPLGRPPSSQMQTPLDAELDANPTCRQTPSPVNRQTGVKTLPAQNFVGGKKLVIKYYTDYTCFFAI